MTGLKDRPKSIGGHVATTTCDDRRKRLSLCLSCRRSRMPNLIEVIKAWGTLPKPIRLGIVAMVRAVEEK